jgi:hypothetical protein
MPAPITDTTVLHMCRKACLLRQNLHYRPRLGPLQRADRSGTLLHSAFRPLHKVIHTQYTDIADVSLFQILLLIWNCSVDKSRTTVFSDFPTRG